jgi:hypothetical protein
MSQQNKAKSQSRELFCKSEYFHFLSLCNMGAQKREQVKRRIHGLKKRVGGVLCTHGPQGLHAMASPLNGATAATLAVWSSHSNTAWSPVVPQTTATSPLREEDSNICMPIMRFVTHKRRISLSLSLSVSLSPSPFLSLPFSLISPLRPNNNHKIKESAPTLDSHIGGDAETGARVRAAAHDAERVARGAERVERVQPRP